MNKLLPGFLGVALLLGGASFGRACTTDADCDDGNLCNGSEFCQAGVCFNRQPLVCNDNDPCTVDGCDPGTGCTVTPSAGCMLSGVRIKLGDRATLGILIQSGNDIVLGAFPVQGSDNDPVRRGASVRVSSTVGNFDNTYGLPFTNWAYIGSGRTFGYVYKDLKGANGPIRQMVVHQGRPVKVKGRGDALNFTLSADPYPVDVKLQFGDGLIDCMSFGGTQRFLPNVDFMSLHAPPPGSCP